PSSLSFLLFLLLLLVLPSPPPPSASLSHPSSPSDCKRNSSAFSHCAHSPSLSLCLPPWPPSPRTSLPSFAQAFGGAPSLSRIPDASNDLPPIHHARPSPGPGPHSRSPPSAVHDDAQTQAHQQPMRDPSRQASRKRPHPDAPAHPDDNLSSGSE
ncbi:hypothetical protein FKP32DRAFT_1678248, partial [Trametes sanguinea]